MTSSAEKKISVPSRIRNRILWTLGVLLLAVVIIFACSRRGADQTNTVAVGKSAEPADTIVLAPEQIANVRTDLVKARDLPVQTAAPGKIEFNGNRVTPLFAQFSGRVVRLDADAEVGKSVRQGQILGMLDSPDIVVVQSEYQRAQADHRQALAAERTAQASLDLAVRTRERTARLVEVEAAPQRELQEAMAAETRARSELQAAQAAVAVSQSTIAAARGKLQNAGFGDQEIERLEKEGSSAISRLTPLKAPVGGTIVERNLGLNQLAQAGGEALFKIANLSTVWVDADVYEDQLASIKPGAEVKIQTPAYPGETFTARVDRIGETVDPEKRTVAVRCVIPNEKGRFKPGMFATVVLQSGSLQRAILVPAAAVVASGNRRTVFLEKAPGTYQERMIEAGEESAGSVIVKSGLREGERVVVQGGLLLNQQLAEKRSAQ